MVASNDLALNERQRAFVTEYLKDRNATQAYIRAGYKGGNAHAVGASASRLLAQAGVAHELARIDAETLRRVQKRTGVGLAKTLEGISRNAFYDIRRLFNDDGTPKGVHELDDDTAAAIEGIDVVELWEGRGEDRRQTGTIKKYKLASRSSALDMLMKHLNGYKENNEAPVSALADWLQSMSKQRSALPIVHEVPRDDAL